MAEPTQITQNLPAPYLTGVSTAFATRLADLLGTQIDTSQFAPSVADESALQERAREGATGLESLTGPQAYQQFMSPYQQEVIDTSIAALDREQARGLGGLRNRAVAAGAFGGGRQAALEGEYQAAADVARGQLEANLRQQGFQQAQQQALQQLQAQQGLGAYQSQLGLQQQAQEQAQLDAAAAAARESELEPFTRAQLVGQQLSQITPGAFPASQATYQAPPAPPSPFSTVTSIFAGLGGLGGKLGLFG